MMPLRQQFIEELTRRNREEKLATSGIVPVACVAEPHSVSEWSRAWKVCAGVGNRRVESGRDGMWEEFASGKWV